LEGEVRGTDAVADRWATDARLVDQARKGDSRAFDKLVRRHLKAAYQVAFEQLGDPNDAEDVCQDAFISALQNLESCRDPDRFRSWLLSIVRNRAHNFRSYLKVRQAQPLDTAYGASGRDDPIRNVAREELKGHLREAIAELTDKQREVLLLHDYEGWTHSEIADKLGLSAGASRFHLHVARRALRSRLAEYGPERSGDE
jgi:RNA polymerase sigma-70 factor (ECF subfamily)